MLTLNVEEFWNSASSIPPDYIHNTSKRSFSLEMKGDKLGELLQVEQKLEVGLSGE